MRFEPEARNNAFELAHRRLTRPENIFRPAGIAASPTAHFAFFASTELLLSTLPEEPSQDIADDQFAKEYRRNVEAAHAHLGAIIRLLVFRHTAKPAEETPLTSRPWVAYSLVVVQLLGGVCWLAVQIKVATADNAKAAAQRPALYGIWTVDDFALGVNVSCLGQ